MNKRDFTNALAERMEVSKTDAANFLSAFEEEVTAQVKKGEPVMLTGFCKFARIDRPARMGRNPATGESIKIKAKRVVRISALATFKRTVMGGKK